VIVGVPVQVPVVAVRVSPSAAVPLIDGGTVLTGGVAVTTAVCALVVLALPAAFVAVTTMRKVEPTSPAASV
jgi:hypothetical protein